MPALDWSRFGTLSDAPESNFEALCRSAIRLSFGRHGDFRATAQMPGIEFSLRLRDTCALGSAGSHFGWQCRWYQYRSGEPLGEKRRAKVLDAIRKSEKNHPDLTHWVLWTRFLLTKGDQTWLHSLKSRFTLESWDESRIEEFLSGDAALLRETYFGELLFTPEALHFQHQASVRGLGDRWVPDVHHVGRTERQLRQMLGELASWEPLLQDGARLNEIAQGLRRTRGLPSRLAALMNSAVREIDQVTALIRSLTSYLGQHKIDPLKEALALRGGDAADVFRRLIPGLRAIRSFANFDATNAQFLLRRCEQRFTEMATLLDIRLVAVLAEAGAGKSQLSAQLSAASKTRAAGILLHGRNLRARQTLDDFAANFVHNGVRIPSFEALVAALDAAGQRSRQRLPLVIDGLNEAQDAHDWKQPLSQALPMLARYPHVLLVVTLRTGCRAPSPDRWPRVDEVDPESRTGFAKAALPPDTMTLDLLGFGDHLSVVLEKYFRHYQIAAPEAYIPAEMLSHPLTMRMFCEVTNPTRKFLVGPEAMPRTLAQLFARYLTGAAERIGELSPPEHRYSGQDVRRALNILAEDLWESNARAVDQEAYRTKISDAARPWDQSLVKMMEQHGLLLGTLAFGRRQLIPVYDRFGGFIIANALVSRRSPSELKKWIRLKDTHGRLFSHERRHPLAEDIREALVALVPTRYDGEQLWTMVDPGRTQEILLLGAGELEASRLDTRTVEAFAERFHAPWVGDGLMQVLLRARSVPRHPLNALFFDAQMRRLSNADRDLKWSELILAEGAYQHRDVKVGEHWRERRPRSESDILRARWTMWHLTSTYHSHRDKITRAMYWFGRSDPKPLFTLALESLNISDPYVPERMLAAAYGVVMDREGQNDDSSYYGTILPAFARQLYDQLFALGAPHATTHALLREYARRIIEVACRHRPKLLSKVERTRARPPYPTDLHRTWSRVCHDRHEADDPRSPFRMDFENYTIGSLVPERANYDSKHPKYREIREKILWRVLDLGWSDGKFRSVDDRIASREERRRSQVRNHKVDRYGKKYSWIAYHEMAGVQRDLGIIVDRWKQARSLDLDIDPSFPEPVFEEQLVDHDLLGGPQKSLRSWIERGPIPNTGPLLRRASVSGTVGPWIMLDGYFTQEDKVRGRDIFGFVRTFLVDRNLEAKLIVELRNQSMRGRWLPENPAEIYAFAGEFPWADTYGTSGDAKLKFVKERKTKLVRKKASPLNILLTATFEAPSQNKKSVQLQRIIEKTLDFPVTMPVCEDNFEGDTIDDVRTRGIFVAKQIALALKLRWIPGGHDLQDDHGPASRNIQYGYHSRASRQSFLFLREDLLRRYLKDTHQSLIWVTWGERGITHNLVDRYQNAPRGSLGPATQVFHTVRTYRPEPKVRKRR